MSESKIFLKKLHMLHCIMLHSVGLLDWTTNTWIHTLLEVKGPYTSGGEGSERV